MKGPGSFCRPDRKSKRSFISDFVVIVGLFENMHGQDNRQPLQLLSRLSEAILQSGRPTKP